MLNNKRRNRQFLKTQELLVLHFNKTMLKNILILFMLATYVEKMASYV